MANHKEAPQFPSGYRRLAQDAPANLVICVRAAFAAKHKLCDPSDFGFDAQLRLFKTPIHSRVIRISAILSLETKVLLEARTPLVTIRLDSGVIFGPTRQLLLLELDGLPEDIQEREGL
jgi:hypothetical protein